MEFPIYHVDAFARGPFTGNPAAVCLLTEEAEAGWMQRVAGEMNLSETAFLRPNGPAYELRWFSPETEVDLCGHATLATAHILWEEGLLPASESARFDTRSGRLTATLKDGWIDMDFPAEPESASPPPAGLIEALGVTPRYVGRNRFDYLVEVESEEIVRGLRPDFGRLAQLKMRGVMVTAASASPSQQFVSRFFAPGAGIPEDPVTGSAHCCLGPFWGRRLNTDRLTGYQVSARGGEVRIAIGGDRVRLAGQAVTVLRGKLSA